MLRSGAPTQLTQVFAGGSGAGPTNVIPLTPTGSQPTGQIAYSTGFTSTNMTPIASGGVAPWGADMNGLLKAQTQAQIYQQAGFLYPYSSAFSTAMSGYPAGAVLPMASGLGLWLNQTDGNTTDPDSSGASGWVPHPANQGVTALTGLTGGTAVLTPNQLGAPFITLAGALTSNLQVTLPLSAGRTYTIQNNTTGAHTVTVAGATGTGVTISQGTANGTTVYTDGTNWYTGQFNGAGVYLPINGTAVAATKLATARTIAMTGDVSWTSPAFDGTANVTAAGTIAAGAVTLAKMANFQANSLMGNPTGSAAAPSAITLQNGLTFSGSNLGLGAITPGSVTTSGNVQLNGGQVILNTNIPSDRYTYIFTNGSSRWRFGGNGDTESGSNAGSNFVIVAFNDAGNYLSTPLEFIRSTGVCIFAARPVFGSATPWDSANVTPLDRNTGGIINAPLTITGGNANPLQLISSSINDTYLSIQNTSTSGRSWAVGTTGSSNIIGPVGTFFIYDATSNTSRLQIDASGNATINGNLAVTGTINFGTSDATLKQLGEPVEPRPFHRVPYYAYTRKDTGERGWGPTAQAVAAIAPEYARTQRLSVNGDDRDVLLLAKEQITMDTAFWAGRQVDLLWQEIAELRRQLADARAH